ncbi:uncharacterized protein [Sylvia atricapilla]|uniref:uncharacterized protein n=1 Tax=Sylvia atricapilla TaxID=48155 RepID=UPI00339B5400
MSPASPSPRHSRLCPHGEGAEGRGCKSRSEPAGGAQAPPAPSGAGAEAEVARAGSVVAGGSGFGGPGPAPCVRGCGSSPSRPLAPASGLWPGVTPATVTPRRTPPLSGHGFIQPYASGLVQKSPGTDCKSKIILSAAPLDRLDQHCDHPNNSPTRHARQIRLSREEKDVGGAISTAQRGPEYQDRRGQSSIETSKVLHEILRELKMIVGGVNSLSLNSAVSRRSASTGNGRADTNAVDNGADPNAVVGRADTNAVDANSFQKYCIEGIVAVLGSMLLGMVLCCVLHVWRKRRKHLTAS